MVLSVLLIGFAVIIAIGVPIAWALGISALGALLIIQLPLSTVPQKIFSGMDVFPLLCVPFFVSIFNLSPDLKLKFLFFILFLLQYNLYNLYYELKF